MIEVQITTEYITLGQFLKYQDIVLSGVEAKKFIIDNDIFINDEKEVEKRRGRKLYHGYTITLEKESYLIK
jgi:ribosome-associated protein YbcJ (S4-like RNA binding protein)